MLFLESVHNRKHLTLHHIAGKYEGEGFVPINVLSCLPTKIFIQNVNSPTLTVSTGPAIDGPFTNVLTVKKGKIEEVLKYVSYLTINFANNKTYDLWIAIHK